MAYTLGNKCAKNLCKQTVLVQLIIENVVTCFLEHSLEINMHHLRGNAIPTGPRSLEQFWRNIVSLSLDSQVS